jgi:uncharacterized repeat protein (TIGR02543 family)
MGSVTGSGDYAANSTVSIGAIANTGYQFVQWSDGNTDNPRSITVTQDISYTATFAPVTQNTYRVTILSNDRSRGSVMGDGVYAANTTISIGAIPNAGYRFVQWDDGNTDNPRGIMVTQDTTFIATFEPEVGITELETSAVAVYPNPATDNITITLPENVPQAVFTLYDMQGKVLIRKDVINEEMVSVDNLATGMYLYNLTTEKKNYTGKIIRK